MFPGSASFSSPSPCPGTAKEDEQTRPGTFTVDHVDMEQAKWKLKCELTSPCSGQYHEIINPLVYTLWFWSIRQNCKGGNTMLWSLQVFPPSSQLPSLELQELKIAPVRTLGFFVLAKEWKMANSQWTMHSSNGLQLPYGENTFLWI